MDPKGPDLSFTFPYLRATKELIAGGRGGMEEEAVPFFPHKDIPPQSRTFGKH